MARHPASILAEVGRDASDECSVRDVTTEDAKEMLIEWITVTRHRDNRVRRAVKAGVSKYRINQLTGIGRSTIDRILAAPTPRGTSIGPSGGQDDH